MNPTFFHVATMKLSWFHKNSPQTNDLFEVLRIIIMLKKNSKHQQPTNQPSIQKNKPTNQPTNQPTPTATTAAATHRAPWFQLQFPVVAWQHLRVWYPCCPYSPVSWAAWRNRTTGPGYGLRFCWETNWATWTKSGWKWETSWNKLENCKKTWAEKIGNSWDIFIFNIEILEHIQEIQCPPIPF